MRKKGFKEQGNREKIKIKQKKIPPDSYHFPWYFKKIPNNKLKQYRLSH